MATREFLVLRILWGGGLNGNPRGFPQLKKWGIIGAIVLVLILVGVGILAAVTRKDNGSFYKFANYVLYEKESADRITETYDKSKIYAINEMFSMRSNADSEAFLARAYELWKEVDKSGWSEGRLTTFTRIGDDLDFLILYAETAIPSIDEMKQVYAKKGSDGLNSYITEKFKDFTEKSDAAAREYLNMAYTYAEEIASESYEIAGSVLRGMIKHRDAVEAEIAADVFTLVADIKEGE